VSKPASLYPFRDSLDTHKKKADIVSTNQYTCKEERWVRNDLKLELLKARALLANEQRVNSSLLKRMNNFRTYSAEHAVTTDNLRQRVNTLKRLLEAACAARRQKTREIMDLNKKFINLCTYVKATENKWITVCDKKRLLKHENDNLQQKYRVLQANF